MTLHEQWADLKKRHFYFGEPRDWAAFDREVLAMVEAKVAEARFEAMVYVLLSCGGTFEITRAALEESPKDYEVTVMPDSRLTGSLVYQLDPTNKEKAGDE
jgi:hypothetical protein